MAYLCHFSSFSSTFVEKRNRRKMKASGRISLSEKSDILQKIYILRQSPHFHYSYAASSPFSCRSPLDILNNFHQERSSMPSVARPFKIFSIAAFTSASASVLSFARKVTEYAIDLCPARICAPS